MMTLEDEDTRTTDQIVNDVIAGLPKEIHLHYIDRGDQLQPEQVKALLDDPEEGRYTVADAIWEHFTEWDHESVKYHYEDATTSEERERLEAEDREQEVFDAIREKDVSDPFTDLLNATPNMLFRYRLDMDWSYDESEIDAYATEIAVTLGIDPDLNGKALRELLINSYYGGTLYIAWYTDIAEVLRLNGKVVEFTDCYVLCLDSMNGSGHDVKIDGTIRLKYEVERVTLDHGPYSWTDVCGLYTPAYAADVREVKER